MLNLIKVNYLIHYIKNNLNIKIFFKKDQLKYIIRISLITLYYEYLIFY